MVVDIILGYIIFEYPHSWALQRFPVAKYLASNVILWAILMGLHCTCTNFAGLCESSQAAKAYILVDSSHVVTLRILLGASEGCITNGMMLVTSMFYNRTEIGQRISWTLQCNGVATIISGFLSYGVVHQDAGLRPARWQLLIIIYTALSAIVGVWFLLVFPDNPVRARFLSKEEKVKAIRRIETNQSGTETKAWKREQAIEALKDVKTWLFFLFSAISYVIDLPVDPRLTNGNSGIFKMGLRSSMAC